MSFSFDQNELKDVKLACSLYLFKILHGCAIIDVLKCLHCCARILVHCILQQVTSIRYPGEFFYHLTIYSESNLAKSDVSS